MATSETNVSRANGALRDIVFVFWLAWGFEKVCSRVAVSFIRYACISVLTNPLAGVKWQSCKKEIVKNYLNVP